MTEPLNVTTTQWSPMNVAASTPEQLVAAIAAGQLFDMGMPVRRTGRRHDDDPYPNPVGALLAQTEAGQAAHAAAATKAATAPRTLTDADVSSLDGGAIADLVRQGKLVHLGISGNRRRR